ncbi:hypothetical protein [Paenibacillus senegalensis]|uniref:hypothetical protein n=1 Tax=Paenibacillus senegalensis TaxID=1465766 RepID=UPI000289A341|nr:hypothetical protein [Paenibacillus senegalensis]
MQTKAAQALMLTLLLAAIAGCASPAEEFNPSSRQSYPQDGYLGATSANPGLPTSPTFHNYTTDVRMVKQALTPLDGVERIHVGIEGADMRIRLKAAASLSPEQTAELQQKAQESVSYMMPRYNVSVEVHNGSRHILNYRK